MYIRPISRDDIPSVSTISNTAFKNDELYAWLFPRQDQYPNDLLRSQVVRLRYRLVRPGCHGFVSVTEEGDLDWSGEPEVTGFAFFERYGNDKEGQKWQQDSWFNKLERYLLSWEKSYDNYFLDRVTDLSRCNFYSNLVSYSFYDLLGPRWHIGVLGVSPKFQRRGVGALLVSYGQNIAAAENLPMTLESSVAAKRLYLKTGFKIVFETVVVEGLEDNAMVWEPSHLQGKWLENIEGDTAYIKGAQKSSKHETEKE